MMDLSALRVTSSWLIDEFGTRRIGDTAAERRAAARLGDRHTYRAMIRQRIAEYGTTRAPKQRLRRAS